METSLYIRIRGRVLGPYETEKLQIMVRRGQLSRLHELSTDGVSWVRATNYPELFTTNVELPQQANAQVSEKAATPKGNGLATSTNPVTIAAAPTAADAKWYYSRGGVQLGPVDSAMMRSMAMSGQLSPDDLVWTDGMGDWQAGRNVPGIEWPHIGAASAVPTTSHHATDQYSNKPKQDVELPESLARSAVGARSWVIFVSIVLFLLAGLLVLSGMGLIVEGGRNSRNQSVSAGIFSLLTAVVIAVGAFMLINYGSRLSGLRFSPAPILLERALDSLRNFWMYVGICLIVWLVFLVVIIVFGAAMIPL